MEVIWNHIVRALNYKTESFNLDFAKNCFDINKLT